ncbi:uncharacterized protein BKA78DRAFT_324500 [Phyllosticta capitalensis]|uniref:uncharacterized protein n=1 Tax=Phyllosticta capitalensis TaxID=121624 RepID=UPI00312D1DBC
MLEEVAPFSLVLNPDMLPSVVGPLKLLAAMLAGVAVPWWRTASSWRMLARSPLTVVECSRIKGTCAFEEVAMTPPSSVAEWVRGTRRNKLPSRVATR